MDETTVKKVDRLYNELYTNICNLHGRLTYYVGDGDYDTLQGCIKLNTKKTGTRGLSWKSLQGLFAGIYGQNIQTTLNQSGKSASSQQQALNQITNQMAGLNKAVEQWNIAKKQK